MSRLRLAADQPLRVTKRGGDRAGRVEMVSPSSRDRDYVHKPKLYATLGIGEFWRVDQDPDGVVQVSMVVLDRDQQAYIATGMATLEELESR